MQLCSVFFKSPVNVLSTYIILKIKNTREALNSLNYHENKEGRPLIWDCFLLWDME